MPPQFSAACCVCERSKGVTIMQCSGCRTRLYCSRECQLQDWPTHRRTCGEPIPVWYDRHRKCQDGSYHEGRLELITWPSAKEGTGWGHVLIEEEDYLKRKFEEEFRSDEPTFFAYWPQGFRWTCCGTDGGMNYGCDHHGTGSKPCTCDFCRMGKPLTDKIYNEPSAARDGLNLRRGPDPRSYHAEKAAIASMGRSAFGLDN